MKRIKMRRHFVAFSTARNEPWKKTLPILFIYQSLVALLKCICPLALMTKFVLA